MFALPTIRCAARTSLTGLAAGASVLALSGFLAASDASAQSAETESANRFAKSVNFDGIRPHLKALMTIAQENGYTRAAGTPGFKQSVDWVKSELEMAGYAVTVQPFEFTLFTEKKPPVLARLSDPKKTYAPGAEVNTMEYSGNGTEDGQIIAAAGIVIPPTPDPSSASGCLPTDFPPETAGKIALVQRGTCDFALKVQNAADAGAKAVVLFNEGNANFPDRIGPFIGTLGSTAAIPAVSASFAVGQQLFETSGRYRVGVNAGFKTTKAFNVIADTPHGANKQTIVVGAHLDSVQEGPGINDNGTGTATILEIARQLSFQRIQPVNRVRFAFWGAEEEGLIGSTYYVGSLGLTALENIALNLNFDMLGSPNFARLVYDGDGSEGDAGPDGSGKIEHVFQKYFKDKGLATQPTLFDGRSDYFAFIENGIPAGGLFTGAEEIKTEEQQKLFGGKAGVALDKCYHQRCDNLSNVSEKAINQMGGGAAYTVYTFAMRQDPFVKESREALKAMAKNFQYRGPYLKK